MANDTLKQSVDSTIYENFNNLINADDHNILLKQIIQSLGSLQFKGKAQENTNPGSEQLDTNFFYLAESGTYPNLGNVNIPVGFVGFILYTEGTWSSVTFQNTGGTGGNAFSDQFRIIDDVVFWDPSYIANEYPDEIDPETEFERFTLNVAPSNLYAEFARFYFAQQLNKRISVSFEAKINDPNLVDEDGLRVRYCNSSVCTSYDITTPLTTNWQTYNFPLSIVSDFDNFRINWYDAGGNITGQNGVIVDIRNVHIEDDSLNPIHVTTIEGVNATHTTEGTVIPSPLQGTRVQHLILTQIGQEPTIPENENIRPGDQNWLGTDIMQGEFAFNIADKKIFQRVGNEILEVGAPVWIIEHVSSDVALASDNTYYKVDATAAPVTINLPDPTLDCTKEYDIELNSDVHKVTITTVSGIPNAIEGNTSIIIPNLSGRLRLKCHSTEGYDIILDTRNMDNVVSITADRDFTTDGFEHMSLYEISPSPAGSAIVLTLPPPTTFDGTKAIRASFKLVSNGTVTIERSDGGFIGSEPQQLITTVDAGITISEGNGKYNIIQDSRPKQADTAIQVPAYRLDEDSDITGYKSLALSKDDPRYGNEILVQTPAILDSTVGNPLNYVSYVTDDGEDLGEFISSTVSFYVTTRKVSTGPGNQDRDVSAYYELYKRDSVGTETLIATTSEFLVTQTVFQQFTINVETPTTSFDSTDRLVMKVYVEKTATGGIDPVLETKIEGENGAYFAFNQPTAQVNHNLLSKRDASEAHPSTSISHDGGTVSQSLGTKASESYNSLSVIANNIEIDCNSLNHFTSSNILNLLSNATVSITNDSNIRTIEFDINIDNDSMLTFPAIVISGDGRWSSPDLTLGNGIFNISLKKSDANYILIASQNPAT